MAAITTTSSSPTPPTQQQQQPIAPAPQTSGMSRWVPSLSLPAINLNTLNPFANTEEENKKQTAEQKTPSTKNRTLLSTFTLGSTSNAPASRDSSPARSDAGTTMFAEPDRSDDGDSQGSINEGRRSSRLRSNKPKTCYSVCHPPTASLTRQKLHLRPRSLLQLHKLQPGGRPVPAFEVIPSANFNVRLNKDLTRIYRGRHAVCPNDFVVLRAEKYGTAEEDSQEARDIIGLICNRQTKPSKDDPNPPAAGQAKVKICITSSGAEWEACSLPSGGYEFFTTDSHGLAQKVRWVPKRDRDGSKATNKDGSQRFNFSTLDPNSRRHPVIAALSKKGLDVYETYRLPDPNATPQPTPKRNSNSALADAMEEEGVAGAADLKETSDALREIITMTAIWVTFKEGWSPTFKYSDDSAGKDGARSASAMGLHASPSKSALSLANSNNNTPPGSPPQPQLEKRASIKSVGSGILRRSSLLSGRAAGNRASVPEEILLASSTSAGVGSERSDSVGKQPRTGRARGDSTSTVLVHRAASNRRKNNAQRGEATWRTEMLASTGEEGRGFTPPPTKPPGEQRKEAWENSDATATTQRDGVARPLIPSMDESDGGADGARQAPTKQRTLRPRTPSGSDKRVSDATTITVGSGAAAKSGKSGKSKKKLGWRRLLCGASTNDI